MNQESFDAEAVRAKYRAERVRRIQHYDYGAGADARTPEDVFDLHDPFTGPPAPRPPRRDHVDAVVLGAGLGGLHTGVRLRQAGLKSICLIDRAGDVGGTWYWNRYPGAQCDVESCIYLPLLEEMGYLPAERYAYQPEIFEYLKSIAE